MVIVHFRGRLVQQYRACVVDSLGLGIMCHITVLCVQDLSLLIFMPSLYSHSNLSIIIMWKNARPHGSRCRRFACKRCTFLSSKSR